MQVFDCTVHVSDGDDDAQVELQVRPPGAGKDTFTSPFTVDPLTRLTIERLYFWLKYAVEMESRTLENPCEPSDLKALGYNLFCLLFPKPVRAKFLKHFQDFKDWTAQSKRPRKPEAEVRFRLELVFTGKFESLDELPWEFLFIPDHGEIGEKKEGSFLAAAAELILTRSVPEDSRIKDLGAMPDAPKVLVVAFEPPDKYPGFGHIDQVAVTHTFEKIGGLHSASKVRLLKNPSLDELSAAFKNCAEKPDMEPWQADILHFIGHGKAGQLMIRLAEKDNGYDNRTDDPQFGWMSSEDFCKALKPCPLRLVFLHACQGAAPSELRGVCSTARDLLGAKIPAIVAMQCTISNDDAELFAHVFYDRLRAGLDVEEAVQEARRELRDASPVRCRQRFGTPVLYLQTRDRVVAIPEEPKKKSDSGTVEPSPVAGRSPAGPGFATGSKATAAGAASGPTTPDDRTARPAEAPKDVKASDFRR